MADVKYPYTPVPGKLRDFLKGVPGWGTPDAVDRKWLEQIGYRGGAGRSVLGPLKFVGVLEKNGKPSTGWSALRSGKAGKSSFATLVRTAYADLFKTYPDAHRKDSEALRNFFRANSSVGDEAQAKMVATFKVLTEFGDFDTEVAPPSPVTEDGADQKPRGPEGGEPTLRLPSGGTSGLTLNVGIQLQLPATSDGEVYEKLFAAMRKHLIDLTNS